MRFLLLVSAATALLTGCTSFMPYDDEFRCRSTDGTGKCLNMHQAYNKAVAGIAPGNTQPKTAAAKPDAYNGYVDRYYAEIASMVDKPITPMVKQAKTIRTLILPYPGKGDTKTLWMERYAYTIIQEPDFVLGQYLTRKALLIQGVLKNANEQSQETP
jgi:conjugal transfer pilus assembly protein TraV